MDRLAPWLTITVLAAALTAAGAVPTADHMTSQVFGITDPIAWADFWRPYWNPAPMSVAGVRPGSVLVMKALSALSPPGGPAPVGLNAALAFASLLAFGGGALAYLRRWGVSAPAATFAAAASLLLSPTLFSAWYLPELDALGAGLTLGGLSWLARPGRVGWRAAPMAALLLGGLMLKESSALVGVALLGSGGVVLVARGQRDLAVRHGLVAAIAVVLWVLAALPLLGDEASMMASVSLLERLPVVEHDATQLQVLVGGAGAALVALAALPRRAWAGGVGAALAVGAVAALVALPPIDFYNHYEAFYSTARPATAALTALLMIGLVAVAARVRGPLAPLALGPLAIYSAITATSLVAATAREDMASRISIAAAPLLLALAVEGLRTGWTHLAAAPPLPRRAGRAALVALGCALAWHPVAWGLSTTSDWRAAHGVDRPARAHLATLPLPGSVLVFNHYVHWLGGAELTALGAAPALDDRASIVLSPALLRRPRLPTVDWGRGEVDIEGRWLSGVPTRIYFLAKRSQMSAPANHALLGDLSWTRRPFGLFTPMAPPDDTLGPLPPHNLPEDLRQTTYRSQPTSLETLARLRGETLWESEAASWALPTDLWSIPRRLAVGVPVVERYRWEGRLTALGVPEAGRGRGGARPAVPPRPR